jgi:hypothetical protein
VTYDEAVYLAAVDALRHGQALGSQVFAAQFPGFYELLRGLSFLGGLTVSGMRWALLVVTLAGSVGGWLVGRHYGGAIGGLLVAAFLTIAPPLDLFGYQVIADPAGLALTLLALGAALLPGTAAAVAAGALFGAALSVKLTAVTAIVALAWFVGRARLAAALAGFVVVVAALLVAHAGALGSLWQSDVVYHKQATSTPPVIPNPHGEIFTQMPHWTPFVALATGAVVAEIGFLLWRRPTRTWPLWSWVALSLAFLLVFKPLHYNHLIIFPFALAVAAGSTLGVLVERVPSRAAGAAAVVLALAVVAGYVQQLHRVKLAETPQSPADVAAAHALARLTPPDALIADDHPIVSFLAHRRVVGPLVDMAVLRFETGSLTDAKVIRDLRDADAVVVARALTERPAVLAYIRAHYKLRYDRAAVAIWVRPASRTRR